MNIQPSNVGSTSGRIALLLSVIAVGLSLYAATRTPKPDGAPQEIGGALKALEKRVDETEKRLLDAERRGKDQEQRIERLESFRKRAHPGDCCTFSSSPYTAGVYNSSLTCVALSEGQDCN
jgi:hypothetical protein